MARPRKKFELPLYFVLLLFFVIRGMMNGGGSDEQRRPRLEYGNPPVYKPTPQDQRDFDQGGFNQGGLGPVLVEVGSKRGNSIGTGFAYDGFGQYITARHVTESCKQVFVMTEATKGKQGRVRAMRDSDFSVIDTESRFDRLTAPRVVIGTERPQRGDVGYFVGYPGGKAADVIAEAYGKTTMNSTGRYRFREPVTVWLIRERRPSSGRSAFISREAYYDLSGISGGPAFNESGEVIGTVVAGQPRRGRAITTDLRNFSRFSALKAPADQSSTLATPRFNPEDFDRVGDKLRRDLTVAQIYCKVR